MDFRGTAYVESTDRRAEHRYPIALQLRYKVVEKGQVQRRGFGRTLNIGSHGVLFEIDGVVPISGQMELALNWPFLLHGAYALQLVMRGSFIRSDKSIALTPDFWEFRTAGRALFEKPAVFQ